MDQMIYSLIPAIMGELKAVGKNNTNSAQGWKFRGIDDVQNAMKPLLAKHQVFTAPRVLEKEFTVTPKGASICRITLEMEYFAPDGSSVKTITLGEAMDYGDKAAGKAMSYAYKYSLYELFCIPTQDQKDPDEDVYGDAADPAWQTPNPNLSRPIPAEMMERKNVSITADNSVSYIKNWMRENKVDSKTFGDLRSIVCGLGKADDVPSAQMTLAQAKKLCAAIGEALDGGNQG